MPNNSASAGQKTLFEFKSFDKSTYDRLFTEYNDNESLFRFYLTILNEFLDECDISVSTEVAQIWYHAKKFIQTLCTLNYPENYIERIESVLITGSNNIDFSNAVLLCMFEMMQTSGANVNHHFDKAIKKLEFKYWKTNVGKKEVRRCREDYPDDQSMWISERDAINNFMMSHLRIVPYAIEEGEMTDDYDYSKPDPFFTTSENVDGQGTEDKLPIKKEDIEAILGNINIDNKTKLEYLCLLFENSGVDFEKRGVKAKISRLLQFFTGINPSTCNNYCSYRDYVYQEHAEEIQKMNKYLASINCGALIEKKDSN